MNDILERFHKETGELIGTSLYTNASKPFEWIMEHHFQNEIINITRANSPAECRKLSEKFIIGFIRKYRIEKLTKDCL